MTMMPEPCKRTQLNHELEQRALRVLDPADPALAWIFNGRNGHTRHGVLVQLGHIAELRGDEVCRTTARAVCTPPLPATTRDAAAKLRRYRLGRPDPAPAATSDEFELGLQVALSVALELQPGCRLDVLQATVAKFQAELGELVEMLRATG
jgi:hypothetical protein